MHETADEIKEFKKLVGTSARTASPQLKWELGLPDAKLAGDQVLRYLQGLHTFNFAVSTSSGSPQIWLVNALLYRTRLYVPTVRNALRTRYLMSEPRVSLSQHKDEDITLIINGKTTLLDPTSDDAEEHEEYRIVEEIHRTYSNETPSEWKNGIYLRVTPFAVYAAARDPKSYPNFAERRKTETQRV